MNEQEKLLKAKQRVEALTGFYIHLAIFVLVMSLLIFINAITGGPWWAHFVFLGWGAGVLGHALLIFGQGSNFIRNWQLRKIHQIKDKM
ncbi:MAG: 2TM domain-containing protein [Hyphomicrobiaceae bacterium]